jgi:nucleoside-diphosphate-sugar epimerase
MVCELAPGNPNLEFETHSDPAYLVDNPNRRCPDVTKGREFLSYEPMIRTREGLTRTLSHYVSTANADATEGEA